MRALVLEADKILTLNEREIPNPGKGEYLVRIANTGICNSDIFRGFDGGAYHYPLVMGHEISGTIEASGFEAQKFQLGDRVAVFPLLPCYRCEACSERKWVLCESYDYYGSRRDGGYQDYLNVKEWNLIAVPQETPLYRASLCEPVSVCFRATNMLTDVPKAAPILILGGGLLGMISALILKNKLGFTEVTITDRNQFKLDFAAQMGINGLSYESLKTSKKLFAGGLEACGATTTFIDSIRHAQRGATVVWMGNIMADIQLSKQIVSSILRKELKIKGTWNSNYQQGENDDWSEALNLLGQADWIESLLTHRVAPAEVPGLMAEMIAIKKDHRPHNIFKAIIDFSK